MKIKISNHKLVILLVILILAGILRFYKLGLNPPGLYWDEAVFGYDAYSLLKTGKDHHGVTLPLFFESFGDWKLPVYHYLLVPSIAVFGLNEFAVRLPSAFLGSITVLVFFLIVYKLTKNEKLSLFSTLFLAISPWHIQFSRAGFESTAGLFFFMSGLFIFLNSFEKKKWAYFTAAFILFDLSMYSYHAYRIFTPLMIFAIFLIYFNQLRKMIKILIIPVIVGVIIFLPLFTFTFSPNGRARAISQSGFDPGDFEMARVGFDQSSKRPLRLLSGYWSKPFYYSSIALNNYIEHFSPTFLFINGDQTGRHSQVDMGQIFSFELILIIVALFALRGQDKKSVKLLLAMLFVAPIPASIVNPAPHAYRTLQMAVPMAFLSGLGLYHLFSNYKPYIIKLMISIVIVYSFLTYVHLLFIHYPRKFSADWQDGNKQMVEKLVQFENTFDKIYISNITQVPYIYVLFYKKYDPQKFATEGNKDGFSKYIFTSDDFDLYNKGRILYVAPSWKKVDGDWLTAANDTNGRHIYSLWKINGKN